MALSNAQTGIALPTAFKSLCHVYSALSAAATKDLVLFPHTLPASVKAWCCLRISWGNRHVQAITDPWRCQIQLSIDYRALAPKVIESEHSLLRYHRVTAGWKGQSVQLQHSHVAHKNPQRQTIFFFKEKLCWVKDVLKTRRLPLHCSSVVGSVLKIWFSYCQSSRACPG